MKTLLLQNFVLVALVSSLVQRRLRVKWLVTPLLLLVLIYPLHNQYRNLIRGGGQDVASLGSASSVGMLALTNAMEQKQSMGSWLGSGFDSSLDRLDILQSIADVVYLGPWLDSIRTRDHWWMVGFYPFIPRLLWPSKPVENMGNAFAVKLQEDPNSCAAITYPGDAYLEFGLLGIMVGMFVLGAYCEWLTRFGIRTLSKRRFFVYVSMFLISADLEQDVFAYWTGAIRYLVVFGAVAWLVYRPRGLSSRFLFRRQEQAFEGSSS